MRADRYKWSLTIKLFENRNIFLKFSLRIALGWFRVEKEPSRPRLSEPNAPKSDLIENWCSVNVDRLQAVRIVSEISRSSTVQKIQATIVSHEVRLIDADICDKQGKLYRIIYTWKSGSQQNPICIIGDFLFSGKLIGVRDISVSSIENNLEKCRTVNCQRNRGTYREPNYESDQKRIVDFPLSSPPSLFPNYVDR